MAKSYRTSKKTLKKRVYKKRKSPVKPTKSFVKKVQRIIHKDVETKSACTLFSLTAFNSGINSQNDLCQVIPTVTQGIQDNNRIGDQVRAQRLRIKGYIQMAQGYSVTVSATRIGVRLMMVQPKNFTNYDGAYGNATTWLAGLLKKGGTTSGFTGVVSDLTADINTDLITCYYDKVMYLSLPYYFAGTGTTSVNTVVTQDLRQGTRFFSINKLLRNKLLRYDSNAAIAQQPVNWSPFIIVGYVHLDGSAADVANTQISMAYDSYLDFEDA